MIGLTMLGQATDLEAAAITADTTPALKVGSGLDEAEILSGLDLAERTMDVMAHSTSSITAHSDDCTVAKHRVATAGTSQGSAGYHQSLRRNL
jgi:hypothetical protein